MHGRIELAWRLCLITLSRRGKRAVHEQYVFLYCSEYQKLLDKQGGVSQNPGAKLGDINFELDTAYHVAYKFEYFIMMELLRNNRAVCGDPFDKPDDASEFST